MKNPFKKIALSALSLIGITATAFGVAGCMPKSADLSEPENVEITKLAPPDDGSLPTAHSCAENLAYVAGVFDAQTQYHSYSYGVTSASIATQTTRTWRDYKDGVLITTDLTYSSMVKNGSQTCTVFNEEGEGEVYFRVSDTPAADTLPTTANWSTDAPTYFSTHAYHYTYGLLPTELFNYIVNEQNITSSEQLKVNPDGTYTQNFTLDPVASTYFYQFGMKTRGGLSGYPKFNSISFSVTFDAEWKILSCAVHEDATVNKGVVVSSLSDFTTEYYYGDDHFDEEHFAYYDSYYKQHIGRTDLAQGGAQDEQLIIDTTNVLSNGFSAIMNGGAQYEISVKLGNNTYFGYVFVSLDLANPLETLALKVSLGRTYDSQTFFLEYADGDMAAYYGNDFALSANLTEVKLAVEQFSDVIDNIKAALTPAQPSAPEVEQPAQPEEGQPAEEGSDPLAELMSEMQLVLNDKQVLLTLDTDDLLGLGIGVDLKLVFGINNNEITFRGGNVGGLSIGGEEIDLAVTLRTTTSPIISHEKTEAGANLADYIADVHSLLGAELISVNAVVDGDAEGVNIAGLKGLRAEVTAYADLDGVAVGAEANVSYTYQGKKISAAMDIWYGYNAADNDYGTAYLHLKEFNGVATDLKIKCNVKDIADAISTLLTYSGAETGSATNGLVGMLNGALSSDFSSLLTEMYADGTKIKIGVSVDTVLAMLGVDAGVQFGSCTLQYARGGEKGGELSASLPAIGFALSVKGADGQIIKPDLSGALDLAYVVDDVVAIANSDLLKVGLNLNGDAEGVTLGALKGLNADISAYVNINNIAVGAEAYVSYALGDGNVSARLSAFYEKGDTEYGRLILSLTEINGEPVSIKVACDIAEVKTAIEALLGYAGVEISPMAEVNLGGLEEVLVNLLGADFSTILPEVTTTADSLKIAVDIDGLLAALNVNAGIQLGQVRLAYDHSAENKLVAAVPALGLNAYVCGAEGAITIPDTTDCFDLADLVNTVKAAWERVNEIIDAQSLSFGIVKGETFLSLDGIRVEIWGDGEVCWKAGEEYVALDLAFSITERATDTATFKFIYDKNAVGTPLIRLALNGVGIDIYKDDIEGVKSGFNDIYNKVSALLGNGGAAQTPEQTTDQTQQGASSNTAVSNDKLMAVVFGILTSNDWVSILNDFTLTSDGKSVALKYLSDNAAEVNIGTDGALTLYYKAAMGARFTMGGSIYASATAGSLVPSLRSDFEACQMSSSKEEGSAGFVRLAYNYLFEALHAVSVENILGDSTYAVTFELNGENCNIPELDGVLIDAEIYVTGEKDEQGKLAEANLNINVAGVKVKLNVITERKNNQTYFYMNLSQVADIKLPDLKFKATQDSLFETLEALFNTIKNTDVIDFVGGLIGGGNGEQSGSSNSVESTAPAITQEQTDKLASLLEKLMQFNFSQAVTAVEVDGITTATIDLDNVVKQLGIESGKLGTVEAVINHNDHSMKTSGKANVTDADGVTSLKEWISLSSELTARRDYSAFDRNEYVSIEFLPDLINDLVKFATADDGSIYDRFTLSGSISAKIVDIFNIEIDVAALTVGFGNNDLYFSGVLHVHKMSALGLVTIPESTVGITYQNGYITLAKGLNTTNPEYKIVTMDYFVDHMLTKDGSVLQWWLDIGGWNTVISIVNKAAGDLNVNSGLTTPQDVYLYHAKTENEEQEISMYDFVDALRVVINGKRTANFGDISGLENEFGITDNYYGFALNAGKITNDVLTKLYVALLRNDGGISGARASGAISTYVTFSATLNYQENLAADYQLGTSAASGVNAPSLYKEAMAKVDAAGTTVDFGHFVKMPENGYDEIFGCFSTADMTTDYSHVLYSHTLTVVGLDGKVETMQVRHGSNVYLYDNYSPLYADSAKNFRILYSTSSSSVGDSVLTMNGDTTVYAVKRAAVNVVIHSGTEELVVTSFLGDKVPTTVKGLDCIGTVTYEGGAPVGAEDRITTAETLHLYGTFVESEKVVNFVKYQFNAETNTYTAVGRAAGFNDYYCVKGNTLVLENEIGGYRVTAIGDNAFANTEGHALKSVVVPANITFVGKNAFLDNVGMNSAVFLAPKVTMDGSSGEGEDANTTPFYGCSVEGDENTTQLTVYYNKVEFEGSETNMKWTKFRRSGSGAIYHRYYVATDPSGMYDKNGGGALYSEGKWCYVDYSYTLNTDGVQGASLTDEILSGLLSSHYGFVFLGEYAGSTAAQNAENEIAVSLAQYNFLNEGVQYKCGYTLTYNQGADGKLYANYAVAFTAARIMRVYSPVACVVEGTEVEANVACEVVVDLSVTELGAPTSPTHIFLGWESSVQDGVTVMTAKWRERQTFNLTVKVSKGLTDRNNLYVNGSKVDSISVTVLEGQVEISVENKVLTVKDSVNTYRIEVKEINWLGKEGSNRNISCGNTGTITVSGAVEISVSY